MPGNVRWATIKEQSSNTRANVWITHEGITLTIDQWGDELGIPKSTMYARARKGYPHNKVLGF